MWPPVGRPRLTSGGTSREARLGRMGPKLCLFPVVRSAVGEFVEMGKRVSGPPMDRSRRCVDVEARGEGAGEVARLRDVFSSRARVRSSM